MYLLDKLKSHGFLWFARRVIRELISPTTQLGKNINFMSFPIYYVINKPINFLCGLFKSNQEASRNGLYFFYDLDIEPVTYDFSWALCIANAYRLELGLSFLKIIFVPGTVNGLRKEPLEYEQVVNKNARSWRIYSILLPITKLLTCSYGVTLCLSRDEAAMIRKQAQFVYPHKYNVVFPIPYLPIDAMQYSRNFLSLRAEEQALEYVSTWLNAHVKNKKIVVITLRQYSFIPARNSNLVAWAEFARAIDPKEYGIVFVPDTEQSLDKAPDIMKNFNFFHPACWNLSLRSALYELAYLNLGVNTGPMALCWLNPKCRYITFKTITDNAPQASLKVLMDKGFVPNKNPKFATQFQKWVWKEDQTEILLEEFRGMCDLIESQIV